MFVHSGPGASCYEFTEYQAGYLARSVRLIALDQRGVLRPAPLPPGGPLSEADLVRDLETVRQALGVRSWSVLGHSHGGRVALRYALACPDAWTGSSSSRRAGTSPDQPAGCAPRPAWTPSPELRASRPGTPQWRFLAGWGPGGTSSTSAPPRQPGGWLTVSPRHRSRRSCGRAAASTVPRSRRTPDCTSRCSRRWVRSRNPRC
ncbi:alpha/beta fold hydrolase [Longispora albida]|uniref:alpha/beta fold hydrolase n=1 Tax=Longispora albida TaxID=203523 RepID=UPI003CCC3A48